MESIEIEDTEDLSYPDTTKQERKGWQDKAFKKKKSVPSVSQEQIEVLTKEFLEKGGKITKIESEFEEY